MRAVDVTADPIDAARRIGEGVAAPAADAVDRDARFPHEAIGALREEGMLAALVPKEFGGAGASVTDIASICETLGRYCTSTAMIFAMHQIEVACIVRHGLASGFFREYLAGLVERQWLIASATSEAGAGGELRRSACAVERDGERIRVTKRAPVISYGEEADDILVTARRAPDAAPGDQVLVLVRKPEAQLTRTGDWDTLGMRGTCSPSFALDATATRDQILPVPFADIATETMVPVSHVLWTSLWLGLATDAVNRARAFVRAEARRTPGTVPPGAFRLAETVAELAMLRATVYQGREDYERHAADRDALSGLSFAIRMNTLKTSASQLAPQIVAHALGACGIAGYRNDSPYGVTRHLRDAYAASLMISNDRILSGTASMLLVHKNEP